MSSFKKGEEKGFILSTGKHQRKGLGEQLLQLKAVKLLIFSKTTIARQDPSWKQNGTGRRGLAVGLMAGVGGHWIPLTKVMKERHMAGVQPA